MPGDRKIRHPMHGADRFAINTSSYRQGWSVEACLKHLNDRGFHHFEVTPHPGFLRPDDMDKAGCAHFQRFLAGHRLRIVALNTTAADVDVAAASAEARLQSLDFLERCVTLGGDIGSPGVVVGIGSIHGRDVVIVANDASSRTTFSRRSTV